jgi:hypothetical protein
MVLRLNPEILQMVESGDFDRDIKKIIVQCLMLEGKRYKTKYPRFTEDYDNIIENFVVTK